MHRSKISWCDYSGGNANYCVRGKNPGDCEASLGCRECYVKRCWVRNPTVWPDITTAYPQKLANLARCKPTPKKVPYRRGPNSKPMIFVCDTGDMFHDNISAEFISDALNVMRDRDDIDWQILTKRALRAEMLINAWLGRKGLDKVPPWMWIGFTAENQEWFDKRWDHFKNIPAAVRWVSIEPMIGPIIMGKAAEQIDWVVVGGESGRNARPMLPFWPISLLNECHITNTAYFFKQWGDADQLDGEMAEWAGWSQNAHRHGDFLGYRWWTQFPS